mmetsp:Transcript_5689/g.9772  ORF Transcript_5689/g.9772 Transcript_5689/m.9772 type:complete len:259 (+) Transcript_5689:665-1441(+)
MQSQCSQVKRMVPYFKEFRKVNGENGDKYASVDEFLFEHMDRVEDAKFNANNRNLDENVDVQMLPDGVFTFAEASEEALKYEFRVNDNHIWQLHKDNGLTKISLKSELLNGTISILKLIEGSVEAASLINKAYIKALHENVTVVTGMGAYPFEVDVEFFVEKFTSINVVQFIPLAMSLGLPVFLYQIVMEKEKRLLQYMRINGLRMEAYWRVNYLFNMGLYMVVYLFFFSLGFLLDQKFFRKTSFALQLLTFVGWGLA